MKNSVVVYYTWSGKTKRMAEIITEQTGADVLEIKPETPYTTDYNRVVTQAKEEIRQNKRPAICPVKTDWDKYETVYVGTPIWWGTMAPPLATFLEQQDFTGKTVMPFSTHGGGGKGHSDRDIAKLCKGAEMKPMYTAYEGGGQAAKQEMEQWIRENAW